MTNKKHDKRGDFLHALKAHQIHKAIFYGRSLVEENDAPRQYSFIRKNIEKSIAIEVLPTIRVALLSSFSIDFIHDALIAIGFLNSLRVEIYQSGFAQFRQESPGYGFSSL